MYLSKWQLDKRKFRNPYQIHRQLWLAFPDMNKAARPFLYRIDWHQSGHLLPLLMQSTIKPLPLFDKGCELLASKEFFPQFQPDQHLRFLLCANPVKRFKKEDRKYNPRKPLFEEAEQIGWLERQLQDGASLEHIRADGEHILYFRTKKEEHTQKQDAGKIVTVNFFGTLTVNNGIKFNELLENGIGPAKSFGCGLLSLARI